MDVTILNSLTKIKSTWELMSTIAIDFENVNWKMILDNLIVLFRKNTFHDLVKNEKYYPQVTQNCRYYVKPNDGSCGKGIYILNEYPTNPIENHTICPEIITPLLLKKGKKYKYDYRVWIAINSDLTYHICPTFICRISNVPFSLNTEYGSLTNTALYSDQVDHNDDILYEKINIIVNCILSKITPNIDNSLMLTGWDFIESEKHELFILEINPNPSINIQHKQVMTEFLNYINHKSKNISLF